MWDITIFNWNNFINLILYINCKNVCNNNINIIEFIKITNPEFNLEKEYTESELLNFKATLEKNNIKVPWLFKYSTGKYGLETRLCFLNELIKEILFIENTKDYISNFVKKINPEYNLEKEYTESELKCLKSYFEEHNINIPCLIKYKSFSDELTKECFLKELLEKETKIQFKNLTFGDD